MEKKKKIAVVYTSMGSVEMLKKEFSTNIPGCELSNIVDDGLMREINRDGRVNAAVRHRLMHYFEGAAAICPDIIVCACSSVGDIAQMADSMLAVPVVRIDHAMIKKALEKGNRIGVLASVSSTLTPTVDYIYELAKKAGRKVEVIAEVAKGAYEANCAGDLQKHDAMITECAKAIADKVDVIILAQGSMSRLEEPLSTLLNMPVLSSPHLCVLQVKEMLYGEKEEK